MTPRTESRSTSTTLCNITKTRLPLSTISPKIPTAAELSYPRVSAVRRPLVHVRAPVLPHERTPGRCARLHLGHFCEKLLTSRSPRRLPEKSRPKTGTTVVVPPGTGGGTTTEGTTQRRRGDVERTKERIKLLLGIRGVQLAEHVGPGRGETSALDVLSPPPLIHC